MVSFGSEAEWKGIQPFLPKAFPALLWIPFPARSAPPG